MIPNLQIARWLTQFVPNATALVSIATAFATATATAAVPTTIAVQGSISAAAGPAADGDYFLTFAIYGVKEGGVAAWKDPPQIVPLKNGVFSTTIGVSSVISPQAVGALAEAWLGVTVGSDPELARRPLSSTIFALRAAAADALDCSGCIGAGHIDAKVLGAYAKAADLSAYAKTGDLQAFAQKVDLADFVKAAALAKVAGSGDYKDLLNSPKFADVASSGAYGDLSGLPKLAAVATSSKYADLTGTPVMAKLGEACGTNLVMRGIKADGSYDCVAGGLTVDQLPKDGLDEISNGLLTNQFTDNFPSGKTPLDIPDSLGAGISDTINVPDLGISQGITVSVDLSNSDVSKVRVTVFDPTGAVYKLYDQGGTGNALKATYPAPDKMVSGDLSTWNGKNPQGIWSINVADLAGTQGGKDGKLNGWSIKVQTLSTKKVAAQGTLIANAGLKLTVAASHPVTCDGTQMGYVYVNSKDKAMYVCNGAEWYPLALSVFGTQANPALHCNELKAKQPTAPNGVYWIDPDGGSAADALQTYCDMTSYGGGWTLVARMTNGCMTDSNGAVGSLTSPSQGACAKLSDAHINAIRTAGGSGGVFWGFHDNGSYKLPASGRFLKITAGSFDANKAQGGLLQQCSCQPNGPFSNSYNSVASMAGVYNHSSGGWECVAAGANGCDNTTVFTSGLFLYQHVLNQPGTFPSNSHGISGGANGWLLVR